MRLVSIECREVTTPRNAADEVFINVDGSRVWGVVNMDKGDAQDINKEVAPQAHITVWEHDSHSDHDQIGEFYASPGNHTLTGEGGHYLLHVE